MKYLIYIIHLLVIMALTSCIKTDEKNCPKEFELPSQVLPYQTTYNIGDNISFISKFSKFVYEDNTAKTYNMENIIWSAGLRILRIDSGKSFDDAIETKVMDNFYLTNCSDTNWTLFTFSNGGDALNFNYSLEKDSFNLLVEITPKKKGLFIITFGGGLDNSNQEFEGKCKNTSFNAYGFLNKGKDNNINLLKESPMEHCNTWILQNPEDRFYKKRYFALKVVE